MKVNFKLDWERDGNFQFIDPVSLTQIPRIGEKIDFESIKFYGVVSEVIWRIDSDVVEIEVLRECWHEWSKE
jgi:hypothetical protein